MIAGRGSGVFFGRKRQRFSTSNSPKKTPDPLLHRSYASGRASVIDEIGNGA